MGQCAMTAPFTVPPYGGGIRTVVDGNTAETEKDHDHDDDTDAHDDNDDDDDDLFSVVATPHTHSVMAFPVIAATRCRGGQQDTTPPDAVKKKFLKLHRPDIFQRCIVDPDEVRRILSLQADELFRRQGLKTPDNKSAGVDFQVSSESFETDMLVDDDDENDANGMKQIMRFHPTANKSLFDDIETTSRLLSDAGASSLVSGMTGITTASRSTILAGNNATNYKKQIGHRPKRSILSNDESLFSNLPPSILKIVEEGEPEVTVIPSDPTENDGDTPTTAGATAVYPSLFGRLMRRPEELDTTNLSHSIDVRRSQYMSVLRLKMKANLGPFYRQRYHLMFSNSPKLIGPNSDSKESRTEASIPELKTLGSSDVSSTSENSESHNGTYKTISSDYVHYGSLPPVKSIKCSVTGENFLDLAVTGSLGLLPHSNGRDIPWSKPHRNPNQKSPDEYIVLVNRRSGFPVAVCALKAAPGYPVVRIYATRQRVFTQRPSATTQQLGIDWAGLNDVPLYAWAELVCDGEFPDPVTFCMYMANGSEGRFATQHSYEAAFNPSTTNNNNNSNKYSRMGRSKSLSSQFVIQVKGRTDLERVLSGCALISLRGDDDGGGSFNIDLSQGIDPALLICFTAIIDEIVEKYMRTQCKTRARNKIRNMKKKAGTYR